MSNGVQAEAVVPYLAAEFDARRASISHVRRQVTQFAESEGMPPERVADVALAVSEAVTNAVVHAYNGREGRGPRAVHVAADVEDGALEIVIADDGHGLRGDSAGIGAGLALVAATCDDYAIRERSPSGLEIWMRFQFDD